MTSIALFFAGAFLCNAIPHLSRGLCGLPFPTPFAKPRGIGLSSPLLNVIWGTGNLFAGLALLHGQTIDRPEHAGLICAGFLLLGIYMARHFGKVMK